MNWMSKHFTFVIIPEGNQSVRRYRLNRMMLVLTVSCILLLAICSALFIYLFWDRSDRIQKLEIQLTATEADYEQQLQSKRTHITALQGNVLQLTQQAQSIERQMSEIKQLESQLKEIAGIKEPAVRISSSAYNAETSGQGGEEVPVPVPAAASDAGDAVAAKTMDSYSDIQANMEELGPSLKSTISALLKHQHTMRITPTIWPADSRKMTSQFGYRRDPISGRSSLHNGLDIGGRRGDPVYATADGTVTLSERSYPHGNNILIDHGKGIETRYLHLNARNVEVGDQVVKGQQIGELGNTGRSTGPHLHYEVIVNGSHVNPLPYIQDASKDVSEGEDEHVQN
ncbi:peptidoglycan DD-metalloendopeptidase family protein [Paenibacillus sp. J5C_2022]|uniref:M23 family metallopeptidase n=1 Tax=Paenibacillus sp. J5C2022 TaxID=2977129 RepID=UPI0021D1C153|nr:M23 family metallopeptidase [Paenibacillus sp. J5C2022]MCU6711751.1 peptidoglycan DD-metalloendopeptidase family protein [Paenibacillus sp. J5C2022]